MAKDWNEIEKLAELFAMENMENGLNCAESVFEACIRSGALDAPHEMLACATAFGSGGGCSGYTCGALAGAMLANSMVHGRKDPMALPFEPRRAELREKYYRRYNGIVSDFIKECKYGLCRDLIDQFEVGYGGAESRRNCKRLCGVGARLAVKYLQMSNDEAATIPYDMSVVGIKGWTER